MSWAFKNSFAALKHRNFRLFLPGQFISLIGFWMQSVGQGWLVYRLTGSAVYLGLVAFSQQIPILLLSFAAGGLVDRTNRHRLIIATQSLALLQATLLTVLTYSGRITIAQVLILGSFLGIVSAIDMPARQAFLVQMVGRNDLMNAIALNSSMFNAARMIGPAVAGFVIARWGEVGCFLVNALSYVAVLISLLLMKIERKAAPVGKGLLQDLGEGLRFIRTTAPVRVMLQLVGVLGIAGFSFSVLLPIFADRIFARGAAGLGWLMTAVGCGALCGALFLAGRKGISGLGRLIQFSAYGFSGSLILFSLSTNFWLSFILLIAVGIFMMTTIASINTTIQSIIPDELRGRVMSLFTTMLIGTAPIGSLICGSAARLFGAQITVFGSAVICLTASIWFQRSMPRIASEARRLYLLQNPVATESGAN